ncbi:AAA family ATPase [Mycolicibacterium confluentis]|uniref:AAA family ATPase n=1 Tax=Mycolicibacterium confluentis TaxID=28047 RepID=UPI001055F293|nr:AAA family ATPase [Mycolicibacterium confluentis]MCV7322324.1 AAA family ATPase [Mycolicibacterium confluentis]
MLITHVSVATSRIGPMVDRGGNTRASVAAREDTTSHRDEVAKERDMESRYRQQVRNDAARLIQPDGARNGHWTGSRVRTPKPVPFVQLEGRVALRESDPDLGGITEFYIGRKYAQIGDAEVFSWKTPLARLFFDSGPPDPTANEHTTSRGNSEVANVAAVRTFDREKGVIADFFDNLLCDAPPSPVFGRPKAAARPHPKPRPPVPQRPQDRAASTRPATHNPEPGSPRNDPVVPPPKTYVRAEPLLRAQLQAPRPKKLAPVLSTLQPEQYRMITAPFHASMIIEGGPGTGKSIIASHRAAYFVGADAPRGFTGDVLVVGPTARYTEYISGVIAELTGDSPRVEVIALDGKGMPSPQVPDPVVAYHPFASVKHSRTSLDELIHETCTRLTNGRDTRLTMAQVYEYLRGNGTRWRVLTDERAWISFLAGLPPYQAALSDGSHATLRGAIEKHLTSPDVKPTTPLRTYGHVIVDEAQDVTIEQWLWLRQINNGGSWTILGDLHQRRADKTPQSWTTVLRATGLSPDTPRRLLERGYRSTTPILEFASRLLPKDADAPVALRADGPEPVFVRPIREHVVATVFRQIDRLITAHPGGSVAVITTLPGPIVAQLREGTPRPNVVVLVPNHARGLEFDAVIVVEPDEFPVNDHRRHGLLYTALTRPNKELVVVHSRELPLQLVGVARRSPAPPPRRTPEPKAVKKSARTQKKVGRPAKRHGATKRQQRGGTAGT